MLAIFFLHFFSLACSPTVHEWHSNPTVICPPCFYAGKISLSPKNSSSGLEVEIVQGSSHQRMYVNVFSVHLPVNPKNPSKIEVTVITLEKTEIVEGDVFDGGQRVLLPNETKERIIQQLLNNQSVEIRLGRYSDKIIPTGFAEKYHGLTPGH